MSIDDLHHRQIKEPVAYLCIVIEIREEDMGEVGNRDV
jgi:hypothetical protein